MKYNKLIQLDVEGLYATHLYFDKMELTNGLLTVIANKQVIIFANLNEDYEIKYKITVDISEIEKTLVFKLNKKGE